jgi:hypothetical protein
MGIKKDAFFRHMVRTAVVTKDQRVMDELEGPLAKYLGNVDLAVNDIMTLPDSYPNLLKEINARFDLSKIDEYVGLADAYGTAGVQRSLDLAEEADKNKVELEKQRRAEEERRRQLNMPSKPKQKARQYIRQTFIKEAKAISSNMFLTVLRGRDIELYNALSGHPETVKEIDVILKDIDNMTRIEDQAKAIKEKILATILKDYYRERAESRNVAKGLTVKTGSFFSNKDIIKKVTLLYLNYLDVR